MHEMSIAESILSIVDEEITKHGCTSLSLVRVRYGTLSQVVPDSLRFCFEAITKGGPHEGAVLELEEVPLLLRCGGCAVTFSPPDDNMFAPCPTCAMHMGHEVVEGRELNIQHLEAE